MPFGRHTETRSSTTVTEPIEQSICLTSEKASLDEALTWVVQQVDRLGIVGDSAPVVIAIDSEMIFDGDDEEVRVVWCASVAAPYQGAIP